MEILDFLNWFYSARLFSRGSGGRFVCYFGGDFSLRQLSLIGDGLSHISFGALALGLFLGIYPIYIALPVAILASCFIIVLKDRPSFMAMPLLRLFRRLALPAALF